MSACLSICLEPNIMNSVFSLLSLSHIDVIQLAILVKVFSMVLIVHISTYIPYEFTSIINVTRNTGIHIFHIIGMCS